MFITLYIGNYDFWHNSLGGENYPPPNCTEKICKVFMGHKNSDQHCYYPESNKKHALLLALAVRRQKLESYREDTMVPAQWWHAKSFRISRLLCNSLPKPRLNLYILSSSPKIQLPLAKFLVSTVYNSSNIRKIKLKYNTYMLQPNLVKWKVTTMFCWILWKYQCLYVGKYALWTQT